MMRPRAAECVHDVCHQPLGTGAHVQRLRAQPQGIDAGYTAATRASQAAQSPAADSGHCTLTPSEPRLSSMRMLSLGAAALACGGGGAGSDSSTNSGAFCTSGVASFAVPTPRPRRH